LKKGESKSHEGSSFLMGKGTYKEEDVYTEKRERKEHGTKRGENLKNTTFQKAYVARVQKMN